VVNVFIVGIALVALVRFFIAYCHSLLSSCSRVKLSEEIQQLVQAESRTTHGQELNNFKRLLQLARLCPFPKGDRVQIHAVRAYYFILKFLKAASHSLVPNVAKWAGHELTRCSHFAAVTLDRRITFARALLEGMRRHQP